MYEYAARFLSVPKFYHGIAMPCPRQTGKSIYRTIVELSKPGIRAEGVGYSVLDSETDACLKFFQKADQQKENSCMVQQSSVIQSGNIRKFWEWCRSVHPGTEITMDGPSSVGNDGLLKAQVLMDGKPLGDAVVLFADSSEKDKIELLALLTAAIALQNQDVYLFSNYLAVSGKKAVQVLRPLTPIDIIIDAESATIMDQAIDQTPEHILPSKGGEFPAVGLNIHRTPRRQRSRHAVNSLGLRQRLEAYNKDPVHEQLRMEKAELPMNRHRHEVVDLVEKNMHCIVIGATGSGKTTQVPRIIFEHAVLNGLGAECNIICTQPRRIAATSVARRVAIERGEPLQETVGYQVRMDSRLPREAGGITYCTTGVLLAWLRHDPDVTFDSYSHLIIDEVHERDIRIDFLLVLLKRTMEARLAAGKVVPKIVLMSATIDAGLFAKYFQNTLPSGETNPCPTLSVPGRLFPVTEKYFEDIWETLQRQHPAHLGFLQSDPATAEYIKHEQHLAHNQSSIARSSLLEESNGRTGNDVAIVDDVQMNSSTSDDPHASSDHQLDGLVPIALTAAVVAHLVKSTKGGAILVFLPGLEEIQKLDRSLRIYKPLAVDFENASKFKILPLHSSISSADQSEVFVSVPEHCRKIILATNIAETSVTIPDVRYIVDTGKLREKHYDQDQRITKLLCTWISKSNMKQRAGRAGRVQDGYYFALFSKARLDTMRATGLPEMLRSDLQEVCLDVKAQSFKAPIAEFLAGAIEPPPSQAVSLAVQSLKSLEALTDNEELTSLGRLLASL